MPLAYQFGLFQQTAPDSRHALIDLDELRVQLGDFANPLRRLGRSTVSQFKQLAELRSGSAVREPVRLRLEPPDLDALEQNLQRRLRLLRAHRESLRQHWAQF